MNQVYGVNMHCPEWHCMQELTGTLASVFAIQMTIAQFLEVATPINSKPENTLTRSQRTENQNLNPKPEHT